MRNQTINLGLFVETPTMSYVLNTPQGKEIFKNIIKYLLMPKQLDVLKQVCKHWKSVIEEIPYLKLDNDLQKSPNKLVMAIAPVNSSGDIYQLLAFIILSIRESKQVPPILLAYDSDETKKQICRSYNFASLLGYEGCFYKMRVPYNNSTQPVSRQRQLVDKLKDRKVNWYIDNRLSTTIISDYIREQGFDTTTDIIRGGFNE